TRFRASRNVCLCLSGSEYKPPAGYRKYAMNRDSPLLAMLVLVSALPVSPSLAGAQSLQEAVEQAIRTNPEVLATTHHRQAADQGLKQAQAGYWPRLDVDTAIGR